MKRKHSSNKEKEVDARINRQISDHETRETPIEITQPSPSPSGESYGFKPLDEEIQNEKPKINETADMKRLKEEIQLMLCRYPELVPRNSSPVMEHLDSMNEKELRNVHLNCTNDIADMRGMPGAEMITWMGTYWFNKKYLPTLTQHCMEDVELQRDLEGELVVWLGSITRRMNIFYRLVNNTFRSILDIIEGPQIESLENSDTCNTTQTSPEAQDFRAIRPILDEPLSHEKDQAKSKKKKNKTTHETFTNNTFTSGESNRSGGRYAP